jgi:hypothetical protein
MAVPTNTVQTFTRTAIREDLSDMIYDLFPDETPFMTSIARTSATAVYHEWTTDALAAADPNNATIQGDDATNDVSNPVTRLGNYAQLSDKTVQVSSTNEASKHAGFKSMMAREMRKKSTELKRDMETRLSGNYACTPPGASTAGLTAGAVAWMRTNTSRGVSGTNPTLSATTTGYANAVGTNGTLRTITEAMLKSIMQQAWQAGGQPSKALMSGSIKQTAAGFAGLALNRRDTKNAPLTIIAASDVYKSDFGDVEFVPSRFCSSRDVLVYDPEYFGVSFIQPFQQKDLAENGHSKRRLIWSEYALESRNEAANGLIADVTA